MKIVGYVIVDEDGLPIRPQSHKRWFDDGPSASPAKIYATEKVAARYGKAAPVYMNTDNSNALERLERLVSALAEQQAMTDNSWHAEFADIMAELRGD